MIKRIPAFARNFYFVFAICFLIWMFFFDSNDLINQYSMRRKLNDLKEEKAYYEEKIKEVEQEHHELFSSTEQLEKFARETYLMKKNSEDVFVIVRE